jgi:hypothetical protein
VEKLAKTNNWKRRDVPKIIFVPMKNIGIFSSPSDIRRSEDHLSRASRLLMDAVAQLARENPIPRRTFVLLSGHTAGRDVPSEAAAGKAYLETRHRENIEEVRVESEEDTLTTDSMNTVENARAARQWMENHGASEAGLLTVSYHSRRAQQAFKEAHVAISSAFTAEEVLKSLGGNVAREVRRFELSPVVAAERAKEAAGLVLSVMDRRGWMASRLARCRRG